MALGGSPKRQKFTAEFAEKYMKQWHSPKLDDIIQERRYKLLNDCHFSDRIRQTGILWKKTP